MSVCSSAVSIWNILKGEFFRSCLSGFSLVLCSCDLMSHIDNVDLTRDMTFNPSKAGLEVRGLRNGAISAIESSLLMSGYWTGLIDNISNQART